ncbi:MAG: sodium:solute symporter [Bacteroidales bacterium]|nr:sodium:solute symporter [Bacteroidales bacterium]
MSPYAVMAVIAAYFAVIFLVSRLSGKGGADFYGGRKSPWWVVAIAMIGACMSGVTFVSVPGMVAVSGLGYLQMCLGFMVGYVVIAFVLMPLYYRLGVVSIYQYLEQRFGVSTYKTGAWFFFISKMLGASVRLFLVCVALQLLVFDPLGLPFALNVVVNVAIVLAYTFRNGVRSVIWTDTLKTVCMVVAVVLSIVFIARNLGLSFSGVVASIRGSEMSRIFWFDDVKHPQYFWKQFLGGLFTVIATTGLDQDMMQRALSCKDHRDSQKNLLVSTVLQTVVIFLFLCLGVLMYQFAAATGISATGDKLFPAVATGGGLPGIVGILFIVGLVAAAYGAGGSALTSLTTSFSVDILGLGAAVKGADGDADRIRKRVHVGMAVCMALTIIIFNALNSTSAIDAVYKVASYTYGPLLGLFAFGIFSKRAVRDRWVPLVALLAPALCLVLQLNSERWFGGYKFSYELLLLNAAFTILGLCCLLRPRAAR